MPSLFGDVHMRQRVRYPNKIVHFVLFWRHTDGNTMCWNEEVTEGIVYPVCRANGRKIHDRSRSRMTDDAVTCLECLDDEYNP